MVTKNTSSKAKSGEKFFLRVIADMRPNAQIMPLKIIWEDGREFKISDTLSIKRTLLSELGEQCMAYYVVISSKRRVIYLDKDKQWFIIRQNPTII